MRYARDADRLGPDFLTMKSETMKEAYITASKRIIVALLVALLVFSSFFNVRKAHAFPPAIAAAGGAAALAAELGITTETLIAGLVAVTAAGTGVYLLESSDYATSAVALNDNQWGRLWDGSDLSSGYTDNWDTEYQKWKLGNGKSWEDLSDAEKANWDSPAQYDQSQMLGYLAGVGLLTEVSGGGGYEPSEQPDPDQDPDGAERWQKARNVLTVLGAGGAVALNDAVGWLGETTGRTIKDLLFGKGDNGFGLDYSSSYYIGDDRDHKVIMQIWSGSYEHRFNASSSTVINTNNWIYGSYSNGRTLLSSFDTPYNFNMTRYDNGWKSSNYANTYIFNVSNGVTYSGVGSEYAQTYSGSNYYFFLNAAYSGTYNFPNNASYSDGTPSNMTLGDVQYGQMNGTPDELAESVVNNNVWNNYINNKTVDAPEGQKKAVVVPDFANVDEYPDFLEDTNVSDITPIPGDAPVPAPNPNPDPDNPNPNPGGDSNFDEDLETRIQRLLSQPFNQLFPFCLIGDLNRLVDLLSGGVRGNSSQLQTQSIVNGTQYLELDTSGFGVDGLENIHVDLVPLHDFALTVRGIFTALFITGLIVGTFRFFLVRGGE